MPTSQPLSTGLQARKVGFSLFHCLQMMLHCSIDPEDDVQEDFVRLTYALHNTEAICRSFWALEERICEGKTINVAEYVYTGLEIMLQDHNAWSMLTTFGEALDTYLLNGFVVTEQEITRYLSSIRCPDG